MRTPISPRARLGLCLALVLWASFALALPLDQPIRDAIPSGRSSVRWAVVVESLERGELIASRLADEPLKPASSLKALTCAAALDLLGPDHRIPTTVYADGQVHGTTLHGDLWVLGLADPTYNGRHADSASSAMRNLADSVRQAGIRTVTGDLVVTGLLVYADGRDAARALGSGTDVLALSNDVRDRWRTTPTDIGTARIVAQDDFVRESNRTAGRHLRRALRDIGVTVEGSTRHATTLHPPGRQVARRLSPPLSSVVRRIMHSSINLHADLLLLHIGHTQRDRIRLTSAIEVVTDWLESQGISTDGLHMVDGSGLSHRNRMTARQMVGVMRAMARSSASEAWRQALPLAGHGGTLAHRMRDTVADGNLRAKTGTLTGAASLTGYVTDLANGEQLAFAIIENSPYERPLGRSTARRTVDRVAVRIARGVRIPRVAVADSFTERANGHWDAQRGTLMLSAISRNSPEGDDLVSRLVSTGEGQAMAVTGPSDTDHVGVEALVHLSYDTSVNESPRVPYQGIVVRAEGDDWVRFVADFDRDRTLKLQAHIGDRWQRLATWTFPGDFPDPRGSGWHRMRLELDGNRIRAFFDGRALPGAVSYSRRPRGQSGIYAWHWGGDSRERVAHFDAFRVETLGN